MNRPPILVCLVVGMALGASSGCGKNGASDGGGTGGAIGVAGVDGGSGGDPSSGGTGGDLGSGGAPHSPAASRILGFHFRSVISCS
jgi:hypothetical protein